MADTGFTQINDIILQIPPESIQVSRQSFNYEWQTLRTRSSVKAKSGFSQLDIVLTCKFTDDQIEIPSGGIYNGFRKLRNLVSQFRVTPFCYIENEFLRNAILGGDHSYNMALALRQMEISKDESTTNVVTVVFHFSWFNYFPFSKNFSFKRDVFVGDEVQNPKDSEAWRLLYKAEQRRVNYEVVDVLTSSTRLTYKEFATIQVQDYARLQKEVQTLEKLKGELQSSGNNDNTGDVSERIKEVIARELNNQVWEESLIRDIFGDQTSMNGSNDVGQATEEDVRNAVLRIIDQNLASNRESISRYDLIVNQEWKPVVLNDGKLVQIKNDPGRKKEQKTSFDKSSNVLLFRQNSLSLEDSGIITTGINISFQNILAALPMTGHPFATFQHIGSIDARITLNLITTTEEGVRKLSSLYSSVENQSRRFRMVPSGQRNLVIENDLVNMCGLRETIPEGMMLETVPGLPGTTSAVLVLTSNPLEVSTTEKFATEGSFSSSGELRLKIAAVLERNIKLIENPFTTDGNGRISLRDLTPARSSQMATSSAVRALSPGGGVATPQMIEAIKEEQKNLPNYYSYSGAKDDQKALFRTLCRDYAHQLSNLLLKVFPVIKEWRENPSGIAHTEDFFLLKNTDVFAIEKIQADIMDAIQNTKITDGSARWMAKHGNAPGVQHMVEQQKRAETFFKALNELRDARSSLVISPSEEEKYISEKTEAVDAFRDEDRLAVLINQYFAAWQTFANDFLDKILYTGIVNLPEFKEVREAMTEKGLQSSGGAYPDFPLQELVSILQTSKGSNLQNAFLHMKSLYEKSGLALKNMNMSVLINPDFFFFNPQNDVLETIIPNTVMKTAANAIIKARDDMMVAETDWFQGIYKSSILGQDKFARTSQLLEPGYSPKTGQTSNTLPKAWSDFVSSFPAAASFDKSQQQSYKDLAVAADTLTGHIGPSLSEATQLPVNSKQNNTITIAGTNAAADPQNTRLNYNPYTQLQPLPGAYSVRHRFGTKEVLSELPEAQYLPKTSDPNKIPVLSWPTPSYCQRVTSKFGPRVQPVAGASTNHPGIDISLNVRPKNQGIDACAGVPVLAAADGVITSAKFLPDFGAILQIRHAGGCTTRYVHLALTSQMQEYIDICNSTGKYAVSMAQSEKDQLLTVRQGNEIGEVGPTAPVSTAAHLHFEMYLGGQKVDPLPYLTGEAYKSQGPIKGIEPQTDSVLSKSVEQFEKDLRKGQGFTMMRAFPTFKLYFIESDMNERRRYAFDDFFSYSAVKEIQVIRSRKIAADLCIIELTNVSGVLSNKKFRNSLDPTKPKSSNGEDAKEENPIASMMLQPGVQIQLRLGYSNNPEELETLFNGTITEIGFTESEDLVTVLCQSFATELVQTIHGEAKSFGGLFDGDGRTFKILEELMASPEVVHFGRWETGAIGINNNRGLLTNRWRLIPAPQDDNIFAPMGQTELGFFDALISTKKYLMYQTTIWDVFQEMCLRHPSYIACAVPYEGKWGPRMTMFFGLPDQLYFARDSSFQEDQVVSALKNAVKKGAQDDASAAAIENIRDNNLEINAEELQNIFDTELSKKNAAERERWFQILHKLYAQDKGFIRPFRSYHLLTSSLHIMHNSITSSAHNTFNTVTLQYGSDNAKVDEDTAELNFENLETFTLRADEAIPDEETRERFEQFPNCVGFEQAKQYCVSLLFDSLKEAYKGSVMIIGNPKIKPYDICYIFDEATDMFGPIEVEQVVHRFSQATGFITEITPDLVVHVNQHATLSTSDAMGLIAEHAIRQIGMPSLPVMASAAAAGFGAASLTVGVAAATAAAAPLAGLVLANYAFSPIAAMVFNGSENSLGQSGAQSALGMVGAFIFRKLITRTQLAHPFRFSPLVLQGRPMTGGLPNRRSDGTFVQKVGEWFKDSAEGVGLLLDDTMDRMRLSNWAGPLSEGDLSTIFPGGGK